MGKKNNLKREVDKIVLAGQLYESLNGRSRSIVLSELSVEQISNDCGVNNIIDTLDRFFDVDSVRNTFEVYDELIRFKRDSHMNVQDFLIEFQLRSNKVKASGITLSDGMLGYTLLNCANLLSDTVDLIRATCDDLDYKTVKEQLKKIGFGKSPPSQNNGVINKCSSSNYWSLPSATKVEKVYYGQNDFDFSNGAEHKVLQKQPNSSGGYGHNSSKPLTRRGSKSFPMFEN